MTYYSLKIYYKDTGKKLGLHYWSPVALPIREAFRELDKYFRFDGIGCIKLYLANSDELIHTQIKNSGFYP